MCPTWTPKNKTASIARTALDNFILGGYTKHRKGAAVTRSALKDDESDRRTCQGAGGHFFLP